MSERDEPADVLERELRHYASLLDAMAPANLAPADASDSVTSARGVRARRRAVAVLAAGVVLVVLAGLAVLGAGLSDEGTDRVVMMGTTPTGAESPGGSSVPADEQGRQLLPTPAWPNGLDPDLARRAREELRYVSGQPPDGAWLRHVPVAEGGGWTFVSLGAYDRNGPSGLSYSAAIRTYTEEGEPRGGYLVSSASGVDRLLASVQDWVQFDHPNVPASGPPIQGMDPDQESNLEVQWASGWDAIETRDRAGELDGRLGWFRRTDLAFAGRLGAAVVVVDAQGVPIGHFRSYPVGPYIAGPVEPDEDAGQPPGAGPDATEAAS